MKKKYILKFDKYDFVVKIARNNLNIIPVHLDRHRPFVSNLPKLWLKCL